jgi:hypothetical protein
MSAALQDAARASVSEQVSNIETPTASPPIAGTGLRDDRTENPGIVRHEWFADMVRESAASVRRDLRRLSASLDHRMWLRPAAIAAVVLIGLAIVSYVLFSSSYTAEHSQTSVENAQDESFSGTADPNAAEPNVTAETSGSIIDQAEVTMPGPNRPERRVQGAAIGMKKAGDRDRQPSEVESENQRKAFRRPEPEVVVRRSETDRRRNAYSGGTRPRVVRTDPYRRPPVSSIETIFTGIGANRRNPSRY